MQAQGLTGDDASLAFGLQFRRDQLTLAATYAVSRNHETDDQDTFFDARGWEVYCRYDIRGRIRATAGLNALQPDDGDYQGAFEVEQYLAGVQYAFGEPTFDRMVYLEFLFDEGRLAEGDTLRNRATIGVRWGWSR
jgi:predicted porin